MNLKWVFIRDIPHKKFGHIEEFGKPVTSLRDGNRICFQNGIQMLKIFRENSDLGNIFEDFPYMDDREEKLRLDRDMAQNYYNY